MAQWPIGASLAAGLALSSLAVAWRSAVPSANRDIMVARHHARLPAHCGPSGGGCNSSSILSETLANGEISQRAAPLNCVRLVKWA